MHKVKQVAILNAVAPLALHDSKDALDLALIFGTYEQQTAMFFQGDGVYQVMANQQPETLGIKNHLKTYAALPFYDVETFYVCEESLNKRQLEPNFTVPGARY